MSFTEEGRLLPTKSINGEWWVGGASRKALWEGTDVRDRLETNGSAEMKEKERKQRRCLWSRFCQKFKESLVGFFFLFLRLLLFEKFSWSWKSDVGQ